jgi:hypothetical protein
MSCLTGDKKLLGLVEVETERVIVACNRKLNSIYGYRSDARRQYCKQWLTAATRKWQRFWRFLGFRKPVMRDAIKDFYGGQYPVSFDVSMTYGLQEKNCKDLLRAAQATNNSTMLISIEGARTCSL